jgi:hypothetical protein
MFSNTARTPWPSPSCSNRRRIWGFLLIPAVDSGSTTVCTTVQHLPAGQPQAVTMAVQNNRRTRALSATAFYSWAALRADEAARVKRGVARRTRPFETKIFPRDRDSRREFSTRVQHCPENLDGPLRSAGKPDRFGPMLQKPGYLIAAARARLTAPSNGPINETLEAQIMFGLGHRYHGPYGADYNENSFLAFPRFQCVLSNSHASWEMSLNKI